MVSSSEEDDGCRNGTLCWKPAKRLRVFTELGEAMEDCLTVVGVDTDRETNDFRQFKGKARTRKSASQES